MLQNKKLGLVITGSFCTFSAVLPVLEDLCRENEVTVVMSETAYNWGITDTAAVMAAKAHLRNGRPLILAVSTNDALGAAGQNIGMLLNKRNIYFLPFRQDDSGK